MNERERGSQRPHTSLTFGTRRPLGVSIARPMLWLPFLMSVDPSSDTEELSSGNS